MLSEKVISIIAETGDLDPKTISLDSKFEELNLDSIDGIEIVCKLEEEFDIEIPNQAARQVRSVRDILEALENNLPGSGGAAKEDTAEPEDQAKQQGANELEAAQGHED